MIANQNRNNVSKIGKHQTGLHFKSKLYFTHSRAYTVAMFVVTTPEIHLQTINTIYKIITRDSML